MVFINLYWKDGCSGKTGGFCKNKSSALYNQAVQVILGTISDRTLSITWIYVVHINDLWVYAPALKRTFVAYTGRFTLALAIGCTGKACFGVSNRLHWEGMLHH